MRPSRSRVLPKALWATQARVAAIRGQTVDLALGAAAKGPPARQRTGFELAVERLHLAHQLALSSSEVGGLKGGSYGAVGAFYLSGCR